MGKRNNKRRIFRLIAAFCLLVGLLSISISQALYAKMKAEYDVAICDESMIVKSFDVISIVCIFGAAVLISTVVGAAMATYTGLQQGLVGEKLVNHILLGGAIGAVCGAAGGAVGCGVSAALGKVVAASFVGAGTIGAASGATAGFLNGSISTWINGGSFGEGILAGLEAGAYGAMSGFVLGGLTQGITNHLQGKNFWTGKAIAPVPQTSNSASSAAS